ncbi:hypothetical protein KP509_13G086800 [Ceratopteris richardii]|uniref:Ubiquitin carboxyl-terminal hydrolase n=1 Tax=Ceratopteris richardii TaxID=49495 RepID=A0A8T2TKW3_CERRI|nr:hypothetical protein KP509_13G086800 [Ceratopteris richardii]KAH7422023.1 hypothetical protein KP509_13G086800 [Ceratopteris richardii]KAH7422024.1 hypothetical protein KP509_13G086800 [Ceratopteris richardii]
MATAATQEPTPVVVPAIGNSFSHGVASMSSVFPHQIYFSHKTCKSSASAHASHFATVDSLESRLEEDDAYRFLDNAPPLLLQCTPVQKIGAGLANLGNTCFLNSVLQCLTYTPPLAAYLMDGLHSVSCKVKGFCAMCSLETHVKEVLSSNRRVISPSCFVKNLRSISRSFQMWRQEDAHEYMRYLIEALQKCSSTECPGGRSLIESVFGGRLRSQVKCTRCSHCSNKYDPFLDLSLEVARADSFQKALAHFTAIEVLDGDNKYHCCKCDMKVRALKQFTIDKAPPILTVQLKRFSSVGSYGGKIDKKIHFERELDLKPFVNECEDEDLSYSLYAVLVHSGWSIHSGHYYCFVRTAKDTWHVMDDSQVSQVSESTVLAQKAYILFYVRNVRSINSPVAEQIQRELDGTGISSETTNHSEEISIGHVTSQKYILPHTDDVNSADRSSATAEHVSASELHDEQKDCIPEGVPEPVCTSEISEVDENETFSTSGSMEKSSKMVEDLDAIVTRGLCENSWYKSVQAINTSLRCMNVSVESEVEEPVCSRHTDDVELRTCEGDPCTSCDNQGDMHDCPCNSDTDSGVGSDETSTPMFNCQRLHSVFNVMAPILRTSRMEAASHHAFSILCICAKYCFWSCFWSPL